jgi:hypothetical protein
MLYSFHFWKLIAPCCSPSIAWKQEVVYSCIVVTVISGRRMSIILVIPLWPSGLPRFLFFFVFSFYLYNYVFFHIL